MKCRVMALVALALLPRDGTAQQVPPDSVVQAILEARVQAGWSPSLVVGVVGPNNTRRILVAGSAGPGKELNGNTVFEIGSITKAFTGILLGEMSVRGEVRLDEPVAALLPPGTVVPERNGKAITLVDLSTQRSGLPRLPNNMPFSNPDNPYADYSDSLLFAFLSGYTLPRDIGSQYEYSNLGVGLLGNALARRAKKPYEQLITERVLHPLGMKDTRITLTPELRARVAQGHNGEGAPAGLWDLPTLAGAGALRSTANDMLTFLAANINGAPGSLGQALAMAQETRHLAGAQGLEIGLGWHILSRNGRKIVWHNGGTGGYRSFAGFDPVNKTGVVVLTNGTNDNDDIGFHLLDPSNRLDSTRSVAPARVPEQVLQSYVGTYQLAPNFSIAITREGTSLFGQATGQERFQLYATNDREFHLRVVPARIAFAVDANGQVTGLVLYQNGQEIPGRRQ